MRAVIRPSPIPGVAYNRTGGGKEDGVISTLAELLAYEEAQDRALCGLNLAKREKTGYRSLGAHDPTPTPYFVLDELFGHYSFTSRSRLLDVGCGAGRVLAYFLQKGYPGRATGVELDPQLASMAFSWVREHPTLRVLECNVLDIDLGEYTDFYLFNPFDAGVLQKFIASVESQVEHPVTLVHMSDNGDTWWYEGRDGWTQLASGEIQHFRNERGSRVKVYEIPQHYTVWRYEPDVGEMP